MQAELSCKPQVRKDESDTKLNRGFPRWTRENGFYNALRPFLLVSYCCGLMPLQGLSSSNPKRLRFSLKSAYTGYCVLIQGLIIWLTVSRLQTKEPKISVDYISYIFFSFGTPCILFPMFLQIAAKCPDYIKDWDDLERYMFYIFGPVKNLSRSCLIYFIISLLTFYSTKFFSILQKVRSEVLSNTTGLVSQTPDLPYRMPIVIVHLVDTMHTFQWLLTMELIILVSKCLNERFSLYITYLESKINQAQSQEFWSQMRLTFVSLVELVRSSDDLVSKMILISFFIRVCLGLLVLSDIIRDFTNNKGRLPTVIYLLFSSYHTAYTLAQIPEKAKSVSKLLQLVPSTTYCTDVYRIHHQASSQIVAITCWGFFSFTKTTFIEIICSSLSYELVLVQLSPISTVIHHFGENDSSDEGNGF